MMTSTQNTLPVKLLFDQSRRRSRLDVPLRFAQLQQRVRSSFPKISDHALDIQFVDGEGDNIMVTNDQELQEAQIVYKGLGRILSFVVSADNQVTSADNDKSQKERHNTVRGLRVCAPKTQEAVVEAAQREANRPEKERIARKTEKATNAAVIVNAQVEATRLELKRLAKKAAEVAIVAAAAKAKEEVDRLEREQKQRDNARRVAAELTLRAAAARKDADMAADFQAKAVADATAKARLALQLEADAKAASLNACRLCQKSSKSQPEQGHNRVHVWSRACRELVPTRPFTTGTNVEIRNLRSRPDLNGRTGVVRGRMPNGRIKVTVGKETLSFQSINLARTESVLALPPVSYYRPPCGEGPTKWNTMALPVIIHGLRSRMDLNGRIGVTQGRLPNGRVKVAVGANTFAIMPANLSQVQQKQHKLPTCLLAACPMYVSQAC